MNPLRFLAALAKQVRDFKCPQCAAYALYVSEKGAPVVLCRKCGFREDLPRFAEKRMGYREDEQGASIQVPNLFGGPDKTVRLE